LLKSCDIVGVFYGNFAQRDPAGNRALMTQLLEWVREGRLRPEVSARYRLEDAAKAMEALTSRAVTGKVVLTMGAPAGS
jgi:NADPH2:quinone reductase